MKIIYILLIMLCVATSVFAADIELDADQMTTVTHEDEDYELEIYAPVLECEDDVVHTADLLINGDSYLIYNADEAYAFEHDGYDVAISDIVFDVEDQELSLLVDVNDGVVLMRDGDITIVNVENDINWEFELTNLQFQDCDEYFVEKVVLMVNGETEEIELGDSDNIEGLEVTLKEIIFEDQTFEGVVLSLPDSCTDTDDELEYNVFGIVEFDGESYEDFCKDEVTLNEYYCKDGEEEDKDHDCAIGCYNGACLDEPFACVETDEGNNSYVASTIVGNDSNGNQINASDTCLNSGSLQEYYCNSAGIVKQEKIICEHGCFEGTCNKPAEIEDIDHETDEILEDIDMKKDEESMDDAKDLAPDSLQEDSEMVKEEAVQAEPVAEVVEEAIEEQIVEEVIEEEPQGFVGSFVSWFKGLFGW